MSWHYVCFYIFHCFFMKRSVLIWTGLFYVFVGQFLVIAYLWSIDTFYLLACVNFAVLLVLSIASYFFPEQKEKQKKWFVPRKKMLSLFFQKYGFVILSVLLLAFVIDNVFLHYVLVNLWWIVGWYWIFFVFFVHDLFHRRIYLGNMLFLPKDFMFILSIIIGILVFDVLDIDIVLFSVKILWASFSALLSFVLWIWVFGAIGSFSVWRLLTTRFYLVVLSISFLISGFQFYFLISQNQMVSGSQQFLDFAIQNIKQNATRIVYKFEWKVYIETGTSDAFVNFEDNKKKNEDIWFVWTWTVLALNWVTWDALTWDASTWVVFSWVGFTWDVSTWVVLSWINFVEDVVLLRNVNLYSDDDILHYDDVLVYLLELTNTTLVLDKKIKFWNVRFDSDNYVYFRTAYEKKLIGKNLSPNSFVKCDNYVVMRWILENRDVSNVVWTIFEKYMAKAKELGVLNGCSLWKNLTKNMLQW